MSPRILFRQKLLLQSKLKKIENEIIEFVHLEMHLFNVQIENVLNRSSGKREIVLVSTLLSASTHNIDPMITHSKVFIFFSFSSELWLNKIVNLNSSIALLYTAFE